MHLFTQVWFGGASMALQLFFYTGLMIAQKMKSNEYSWPSRDYWQYYDLTEILLGDDGSRVDLHGRFC